VWLAGDNLIGDYLMQTPAIRMLDSLLGKLFDTKYDLQIMYATPDNSVSRRLIELNPYVSEVVSLEEAQLMLGKHDKWIQADCGKAFAEGVKRRCSMATGYAWSWNLAPGGAPPQHYDLKLPAMDNAQEFFDQLLPGVPLDKIVVCGRHSRSCTSNDPKIGRANKCFANEYWLHAAARFKDLGLVPVAVGTAEDLKDPAYSEWTGLHMYGQSLETLAQLQSRCAFTMSVDTGVRHLAAAAGGSLLTVSGAIGLDLIRCWARPDCPRQTVQEYLCSPCDMTTRIMDMILDNYLPLVTKK
jgi:ADP-heptose:LPS heptosyltransferase